MNNDFLILKGAKDHNLKNIDLSIPKNSLVLVTGLSEGLNDIFLFLKNFFP